MSKAQIAIEFILLTALAGAILLVMLIVLNTVSESKIDDKTYLELDDLGRSIQQELLLASEVQDGYIRIINIPQTVNGRDFTITTGNLSNYIAYMEIEFKSTIIYYQIPFVNGTLTKGENTIKKSNQIISIK